MHPKADKVSRSCKGFFIALAGLGMLVMATRAKADYPDNYQWMVNAHNKITSDWTAIDSYMWFHIDNSGIGYPEQDWRVQNNGTQQAFQDNVWGGLQPGVFLPDWPGMTPGNTTPINNYEALTGQSQARVGWHLPLNASFPTDAVTTLLSRGVTPFIVWEPYDSTVQTARTGASQLPSINNGDWDSQFQTWATEASNVLSQFPDGQIEISFAHEGNGNWFNWGFLPDSGGLLPGGWDENTAGHNGNTAAMHSSAYQKMAGFFDGIDGLDTVWNINASWQDDFTVAYPGSQYVDRLGMNGFNFGWGPPEDFTDETKWQGWREFEQIFGVQAPGAFDPEPDFNNYDALHGLDTSLPIIIGEVSTVPEPTTVVLLGIGGLLLRRRRVVR